MTNPAATQLEQRKADPRKSGPRKSAPLRGHLEHGAIHAVLVIYTIIALFPAVLVVMNSMKERLAIFGSPYTPPTPETFDLVGYQTVFSSARFDLFFLNSLIVTVVSLTVILVISSMAAFALSEYNFRGNTLLGLYLSIGIMVPIRLGTVSLLQMMVGLKLANTLWALILVYVAAGIPLAVFILTQFFRTVPKELKDAARVDGASEYRVFLLALPLVRPALGTVAIFNMIPIWNDLWFPLILAPAERTKTIILGAQVFLGQFVNDWNAVLAALSLAVLPVVVLYVVFSRQLIRGLTQGAVK
jgi:raffinose/stachyose/melibiose transport system permease protein